MPHIWQLQEAKNKFTEIVEEAITQGPQVITQRGVETVVVLSCTEYRAMLSKQNNYPPLSCNMALSDVELDITRDSGYRWIP
jgi:antitoxin Phd